LDAEQGELLVQQAVEMPGQEQKVLVPLRWQPLRPPQLCGWSYSQQSSQWAWLRAAAWFNSRHTQQIYDTCWLVFSSVVRAGLEDKGLYRGGLEMICCVGVASFQSTASASTA